MTVQVDTVYATATWAIEFTLDPRIDVRIDRKGMGEFFFRCTVEGETVEQARTNMAVLKAELQRVLDL